MALKITLLSGPGAGRCFEFSRAVQEIEIGRDPAICQVVFPADYTTVGRRHCGIRQELGGYVLFTNGRNPVTIDGREPFENEPLGDRHEIALGDNGPTFIVETQLANVLPKTTEGKKVLTASARSAIQSRYVRYSVGALSALLFVGIIGLAWQAARDRTELASIARTIGQYDGGAASAAAPSVPTEAIERAARSTYLVLVVGPGSREAPAATAWVVADHLLATNAHVAALFSSLEEGQKLVVRSTVAPYETSQVERVVSHPAAAAFQQAWDRFAPLHSNGTMAPVQRAGDGYDVALLRVGSGVHLAPPLRIAPDADLLALRAGDPLAFVGFPMERLALGGVNPSQPVPQVQRGFVTATSDYFLLPAPVRDRTLVHHSLLAAGGASGSPILNPKGHVVAILSGGNIVSAGSGRTPSAAGINFAQRADLVVELLENRAARLSAEREGQWSRGFSSYGDTTNIVLEQFINDWKGGLDDPVGARQARRLTGTLQESLRPGMPGVRLSNQLREPGEYLVIAVSPVHANLNLVVLRGNKVIKMDKEVDWYPALSLSTSAGEAYDIVLFDADENPGATFVLEIWHSDASRRARPSGSSK